MTTDAEQVRNQLTAAIRAYAELARQAAGKGEQAPIALSEEAAITRTEGLTVIDALLTELELDVFEIQIWRSMRWHNRTGTE